MTRVVRVAVIDSGVHIGHPHVGGTVDGIGIDENGARHADFVDRLGHGTAVTAAILEKAPSARITAIKVFDRELFATGAALVAACDYAAEQGCDVVNLSLGTVNTEHEAALSGCVDRLRAAGAIVIAAGSQDGMRWLPGSLPGVWAVQLDWTVPRETFGVDRMGAAGALVRACGFPRPIPGVPPDRNLKGLSFAVANVTGVVARLLESGPAGNPSEVVSLALERGLLS